MCISLARGGMGGGWIRGLGAGWIRGLGVTNPVETGGVLDACLCLVCGGVCGEGAWARVWKGSVMFV